MKLLFQSDDFGITKAVTLGIIEAIEKGLVRNTGLFTNMDASLFAAGFIEKYPHVCFGVDCNFVAGKPISDPKDIPGLVDEKGYFISSIARFEQHKVLASDGMGTVFEAEPYNYDEVLLEMEAQIQRFIELAGRKPEYLHPHSLVTPTIAKAFIAMGEKYEIPVSFVVWEKAGLAHVPGDWNVKPVFTLEAQKNTDVEEKILAVLPTVLDKEKAFLICHAGYVDADLLDVSSYSLIRSKDLRMATSAKIKGFVEEHGIEIITYRDLL